MPQTLLRIPAEAVEEMKAIVRLYGSDKLYDLDWIRHSEFDRIDDYLHQTNVLSGLGVIIPEHAAAYFEAVEMLSDG